nr:MAG TPA: hypothetical protein [Bacteriophage sp.]
MCHGYSIPGTQRIRNALGYSAEGVLLFLF